jgi:hypothetical protein
MVVRFTTTYCARSSGHGPGDVADLPEDEAFVAIRSGGAVIEPEPQPEHETADGPRERPELASV